MFVLSVVWIVNLVMIVMLISFILSGYHTGFVSKLLNIFGFFVCGFLAWHASGYISKWISLYPENYLPLQGTPLEGTLYNQLNHLFLFVIIFVLLLILVLVLKPFGKLLNHVPVVSFVNRIFGAFLGGIEAILLFGLVSLIFQFPFWEAGNQIAQSSFLKYAEPLLETISWYTEEGLMELGAMAQDKETALTESQLKDLQEWLIHQNIQQKDIDSIISALR